MVLQHPLSMVNMKRVLITAGIIILAILVILIIVIIIAIRSAFPPAPTFDDMIKVYERNEFDLLQIVEALQKMEYEVIGIDRGDQDYHYYKIYDFLPIEYYKYNDVELYMAFENLLAKEKCDTIRKEDSYIFFQWWASMSANCGIAYSIDGNTPKIDIEFLPSEKDIIIQPLDNENWYYYYTKWK